MRKVELKKGVHVAVLKQEDHLAKVHKGLAQSVCPCIIVYTGYECKHHPKNSRSMKTRTCHLNDQKSLIIIREKCILVSGSPGISEETEAKRNVDLLRHIKICTLVSWVGMVAPGRTLTSGTEGACDMPSQNKGY